MHFDIFNDDAFSVSQLSRAMVNLPHQPQPLEVLFPKALLWSSKHRLSGDCSVLPP